MAIPDDSFFTPSPAISLIASGPSRPLSTWPGITPASTAALKEALKKDRENWHIFFNPASTFHNHVAHHVICNWALGAKPEAVTAAYEHSLSYQVPIVQPPEPITIENFKAHTGDSKFYKAYRDFFEAEIDSNGITETVEKWIFSSSMNVEDSKGNASMLARLLGLIIHPFIRLGYGLEFGIPSLVAQSLAETAVHQHEIAPLVPESLFTSGVVDTLASKLQGTSLQSKTSNVHALSIVSQMAQDEQIGKPNPVPYKDLPAFIFGGEVPALILKYVEKWTFDASDLEVVQQKVKELQWTCTLLYLSGTKGKKQGDPFWADFITMHCVTSAVFVPAMVAALSPRSRYLLMSRYFGALLLWWSTRGCPILDIKAFYETKVPETSWSTMIEQAVTGPDDHFPKVTRALAQFSQLYGATPAGNEEFKGLGITNTELLDGTLFYRAAALTTKRVLEGEEDESFGYAPGTRWFWDRE